MPAVAEKQGTNITFAPYGKKKEDGRAFPPNPTQQKLLAWVDRIRDTWKRGEKQKGLPILYLRGAIRAGKTRGILAPIVECLLEIPKLRTLWGRQDFADLRLSVMETFFETVPPEIITGRNVQEKRYKVGIQGSQIFFRELKDLAGLGSQEFGNIIVTEVQEISHQAYLALKSRCMQAGVPNMLILEGNPPNEGHWLTKLVQPGSDEYDPDVEKWDLPIWENWENLPEGYRNSLMGFPSTWKHKFLEGKTGFIPEGKPVYPMYREELHLKEGLEWPSGKPVYVGFDFGFHRPAILCSSFDANGRWVILRELMGEDITIDRFGDVVVQKLNEWFPKASFVYYGDPAGNQKSDKGERTSIEVLATKGISISTSVSTIRQGIELVSQKLTKLIDGIPALLVSRHCPILNDALLGGYHYPQMKEGGPVGEVPKKDGYYEHLCDCLRYLAVNLLTFPAEEKSSSSVYVPYSERFAPVA